MKKLRLKLEVIWYIYCNSVGLCYLHVRTAETTCSSSKFFVNYIYILKSVTFAVVVWICVCKTRDVQRCKIISILEDLLPCRFMQRPFG